MTTEILEKLDPIPVFTIADLEGAPLVTKVQNGTKITGVFISQEDANDFVAQLDQTKPELADRVKVVPVSLGEVYRRIESDEAETSNLDLTYTPETEAIASATDILAKNGREYEGGVPLFVARGTDEGYLTFERDSKKVIPFFFDLEQLENFISKFEKDRPELVSTVQIEVYPLEGVIETFETSNVPLLNRIVLVPSSESLEFLESVNSNVDIDEQNIYRFFNQETGSHFYTASEIEKNNVVDNLPNYVFEGIAYEAADPIAGMDGVSIVHRFLNQNTGVHLYTIDEVEKNYIFENLSNYSYEGEVFTAYDSQVEDTIPIYRFYNSAIDAHFYTASDIERETVVNNLLDYSYEGVAYYAHQAEDI